MEIIIKKSSNVYLYKMALEEFIKRGKKDVREIKDIDYIVGIMFLTELNRYSKMNKLQIHGYYIASVLIILFNKIRRKLMNNEKIETEIIYEIMEGINENIKYINERVINEKYKKKINEKISEMMLDYIPKIRNIIEYENREHNKNGKFCIDKCYICWLDNGLRDFFYILLMMSKYIGMGVYSEIKMIKIAEYYGEIYYIILNINSIVEEEKMGVYERYMRMKTKINEYNIEMGIESKTMEEIMEIIEKMIIIKISNK
jgi:hypothetical protein